MTRPASDSPRLPEPARAGPDLSHELALTDEGYLCVAGVDEAGRGPLAGPVVAAAVVLDARCPVDGLDDSKVLTAERRAALFDEVMAAARAVGIASCCAGTIDATDIRKASLEAMRACVGMLRPAVDGALFDGRDLPERLPSGLRCSAVIGGDGRCMSIAAASIIAKVTRDRMLERLCGAHPGYGLSGHKGYGAPVHREAIARLGGVARVHRFTFRPLAAGRIGDVAPA